MEPIDVDKLIAELEVAVDRLRSLYEQYFMGFEKMEPTVPRKEVERKIHLLRKEQIRNTALRFRFHMILQRYNTYQTHWHRICREIENGTYSRHVFRAQRRFASDRPGAGRRSSRAPPPSSNREPRSPLAAPSPTAPAGAPTPGVPAGLAARPAAGVTGTAPLVPAGQNGAPHFPAPLLPHDLAAELAELDKEFAPPPGPRSSTATASTKNEPKPPPQMRPLPRPLQQRAREGSLPPAAPVGGPASPPARGAASPPRPPPPPIRPRASEPKLEPEKQRPPPVAAPPRPSSPELSEERMRELYGEYVETRRRQQESTAVTYDTVSRSMLESSARLREKHGKAVDFEVAIKDGKTFLRPVLK